MSRSRPFAVLAAIALLAGCGAKAAPTGAVPRADSGARPHAVAHVMKFEGGAKPLSDRPLRYAAPLPAFGPEAGGKAAPAAVDLRAKCPPVYDQGKLEACTAFAVAKGLEEFLLLREGRHKPLSALAVYYMSRLYTPQKYQAAINVHDDTGSSVEFTMKVMETLGAPPESAFPYPKLASLKDKAGDGDPAARKRAASKAPSTAVLAQGLPHRLVPRALAGSTLKGVKPVQTLNDLRGALAEGVPVAFSMLLFDSFRAPATKATGRVPLPRADERFRGGHAVLAVGYDDRAGHLIVRNSFGAEWGDDGYFYLPYDYLKGHSEKLDNGYCFDAWTAVVE